jgi:hypothetical protein
MFCDQCGVALRDESNFCPRCGAQRPTDRTRGSQRPSSELVLTRARQSSTIRQTTKEFKFFPDIPAKFVGDLPRVERALIPDNAESEEAAKDLAAAQTDTPDKSFMRSLQPGRFAALRLWASTLGRNVRTLRSTRYGMAEPKQSVVIHHS